MNKPKILALDVETAPILGYVWTLWENNLGLNQIKSDWHMLSWAAKWLGDAPSKIMYMDQRNAKNIEDDKKLLAGIWKLIDEADILLTQNGVSFDVKKLNARFIMNGFKPPSTFTNIDTKRIAASKFKFTSNKLEYLSDKLNSKYKKLKHSKYTGFELWTQCLAGNQKAWNEMERYNKYDVLALEELYLKLRPWDTSFNPNLYSDSTKTVCRCGSTKFQRYGYRFLSAGKYQRYVCTDCGACFRDKVNLLSTEKRKALRV